MIRAVFAIGLCLSCLAQAAEVSYEAVVAEVRAELVRQMRGERIPGAAVALVDGQRLVWSQGFGYADAGKERLVDSDTPFLVGDFTKLITAIAVLQQVAAGRMALDAPIDHYLPELELRSRFADGRIPTVRELLTHHGGLPSNVHGGSFLSEPPQSLPRFQKLYLAQPPGLIYAYSQLGFDLLGAALEKVTGRGYPDYVSGEVLGPLGMDNSGFAPADAALPHNKAGRPQPPVYPRDLPALGLMSSVRDISRLARWFLADDHGPVLPSELVAEMSREQNTDVLLDLDNRVGLAWQLTNTGRHNVDRVLRVQCVAVQFRGALLLAPAQQLGVVVLANSPSAGEAVVDVARLALDGMLERKLNIPRPEALDELPDRVGLPRGARPDALQARYNTALGLVELSGGPEDYDMRFVGRSFGLRQRADDWYRISLRLLGFIDLRFSILTELLLRPVVVDGRSLLLTHYRGGTFLLGTAVESSPPRDGESHWAGSYRLTNPGLLSERLELDEIEVLYEDRQLFVRYEFPTFVTLRPKVPLLPLGDGRYYVPGLGTNMGDELTLRHLNGQRVIVYSGWVFVERP